MSLQSKNYHDAYFKQVFSKPQNTIDLIQGILPKLSEKIDFKSLQLDNNSYVNKDLQKEFSDLVYTCNYGEDKIKVALLFEHKSQDTVNVELQLASYIYSVWKYNLKNKEELMPVIPILFYHGKIKPKLQTFDDLRKLPDELQKYMPIFELELIDVSGLEIKDINNLFQTAHLKFSLLVMKHIQQEPEKIFEELERFQNIVKVLLQDNYGKELIYTTTIYISKKPGTDMKTIVKNFTKIEKQAGKIAKSAWEKEVEKGRIEVKVDVALRMLKLNFDIITIQQITGLPIEQIKELKENI